MGGFLCRDRYSCDGMVLVEALLALLLVAVVAAGAGIYVYRKKLRKLRDAHRQGREARRRVTETVSKEFMAIDDLIGVAEEYMREQADELDPLRDLTFEEGRFRRAVERHRELRSTVKQFFSHARQFPELWEDKEFEQVRERLTDLSITVEDAIATYQSRVTSYNRMREQFPERLVAQREGFERVEAQV